MEEQELLLFKNNIYLEKETLDDLKHPDLETAIEKFKAQREKYIEFFKENPEAKLKNLVFGELNKYEAYLLERKEKRWTASVVFMKVEEFLCSFPLMSSWSNKAASLGQAAASDQSREQR